MAISLPPQIFFISVLSAIISMTNFTPAYSQCLEDQKILLLELKNDLIFDSSVSRKLVRWNQTNDCCSWEGVECNSAGHVIGLELYHEAISGGLENSSSLLGLRHLEKLNLAYNNFFNGTIQLERFQRLENLKELELSHNNFTVEVSSFNSSLFTFPRLKKLSLASCNVNTFPDFIKQSNVSFLDLSNNRITGEIPSWIWEIGNGALYHLNLSYNSLVDLQKPYRIPDFLAELDLHSNQLHGELPQPQRAAYYVDYSNNNFDKPIPHNFVTPNFSLVFFSLANNSISGSIPTSLCNALFLQLLDLSFNNLSGDIPPCLLESIYNLQVLNLGRNIISGDIPDKFPVDCGLKNLDLRDNILGGNIPKSLANCKKLEVMNVGNNNINDSFPCMLSSSLRILVLRSNRFHGEVRCHESWPDLQIIDIASNNFSGDLYPMNFSSWRGMMLDSDAQLKRPTNLGFDMVRPGFYYFTEVTITVKGLEMNLVKVSGKCVSIDFSCNNFRGRMPDSISDLSSLYLLNLSHNSLTGTIPKSFGKLRQLGSLDLSVNQLTGEIPRELAGLSFLSILNVSYNKLVGIIPNGPQFQTFSADFFEGNVGLCGFPLDRSCSNNDGNDFSPPKPETVQPHGKKEIKWDYVSAALGYVVGLGSFFWVLLCCQSLRRKYFDKVDEILEKIFGCEARRRRHRRRRVLRNHVRRQYC